MKLHRLFSFICFLVFCVIVAGSVSAFAKAPAKNYYQLKIYHYKTQAQEVRLEQYLQQAYVPAIHRAEIKYVGVFKPVTQQDTDRRIIFSPLLRHWISWQE